jgi:hypothetical protein
MTPIPTGPIHANHNNTAAAAATAERVRAADADAEQQLRVQEVAATLTTTLRSDANAQQLRDGRSETTDNDDGELDPDNVA